MRTYQAYFELHPEPPSKWEKFKFEFWHGSQFIKAEDFDSALSISRELAPLGTRLQSLKYLTTL